MKTDIHPEYTECRVTCSCGNQFLTRATTKELRVELCSECHPFYTGKQKLVDTGGRVERFERRYAQAAGETPEGTAKKERRRKRASSAPAVKPPVATKGGPRPKFDKKGRRIGEDGRPEGDDRPPRDEDRAEASAPEAPPPEAPPAEEPAAEAPAKKKPPPPPPPPPKAAGESAPPSGQDAAGEEASGDGASGDGEA